MEYFTETVNATVQVLEGPEEHPSTDYMLMAFSDMLQLLDRAMKELRKGQWCNRSICFKCVYL